MRKMSAGVAVNQSYWSGWDRQRACDSERDDMKKENELAAEKRS